MGNPQQYLRDLCHKLLCTLAKVIAKPTRQATYGQVNVNVCINSKALFTMKQFFVIKPLKMSASRNKCVWLSGPTICSQFTQFSGRYSLFNF